MVDITRGENILKFFDLISLPILDKQEVENVSAFWSITALPNKFREFLFKFFNNRLGLNARTVHFGGKHASVHSVYLRIALLWTNHLIIYFIPVIL